MSRSLAALNRARWPFVGVCLFTVLSLALTLPIVGTLRNSLQGDQISLSADFADASGLKAGDDVRIAGVRIGQVDSVALNGTRAAVRFHVSKAQIVYTDSVATISFLNLMGQRYIGLTAPGTTTARANDGYAIPASNTRVGLDLTVLFNAFKPLFEFLKPGDINRFATDLVQAFQGQGPAIQQLVDEVAQLTTTIAGRDELIGAVITNLTNVAQTVHDQRGDIASMVDRLNRLTGTVAANRDQLARTLTAAAAATSNVSGLLDQTQSSINLDAQSLNTWAKSFGAQAPALASALTDTQLLLTTYIRALGLGSYLNTYVCGAKIGDGNVPPQPFEPSNQHSERCR